uniref:Uncharacterized protein n=1 Tax=Anguilla anguilla TaxID=7936 RepID=A0A0E9UI07_ANGAN
MFKFCSQQRY